MQILIKSFGFKYGEPYPEGDLRIDLRNRIRNPHDHLPKGAIGLDSIVKKTVLGSDANQKVLSNCLQRIMKLLKEADELTISIGCKSGIHRSVVFAEEISKQLQKKGHVVEVEHVHLQA